MAQAKVAQITQRKKDRQYYVRKYKEQLTLLILAMIFIFSRSNKKQQQKRQEMLDRIVKGSRVMLNSGVYGKISEVREKEFLVEIAENVKVLVVKNGIASVEDENEKSGDAK